MCSEYSEFMVAMTRNIIKDEKRSFVQLWKIANATTTVRDIAQGENFNFTDKFLTRAK